MEHSLPFELNEPWRTRAVVAAAIAVLELVVLVIIAVAMISEPVAQRVTKAAETKVLAPPAKKEKPKPKPKPRVALPKLSRAETSVTVLNGNGVQGAAAAQAATIRSRGYTVGTVGNAPERGYAHTIVMYRKGFAPEGRRLARDLGITIVSPLDGLNAADLTGSHVALIIGG